MKTLSEPKKPKGQHGGRRYSTKPRCGAKTRSRDAEGNRKGTPCQLEAGKGTDHPGVGRCKFHGGISRRKFGGLYTRVVPVTRRASYHDALQSGEQLKDMTEHLALLDGVILPGALARGEAKPLLPGEVDPLSIQMAAIDVKSKVLKRQADIEQSRKIAFTQAELRMLVLQLVTIVAEYVDGATLKKIAGRIGTTSLDVQERI